MRFSICVFLALLIGAGCVSLKDANVRKNRIVAETGMSDQEALEGANNALRNAGFRISRHAEQMGLLRTDWTDLGGYDAEMRVWVEVDRGELRLRGWYREGEGDEQVISSPADSEVGETAWQVLERIAQRLPGSVGYEYGFD